MTRVQTELANITPSERFLLMALRNPRVIKDGELLPAYRQLGGDVILKAAQMNWVDSLISHRLLSLTDLPGEDRQMWQEVHDQQERWSNLVFQEVTALASTFAAEGITEFLLLKDTGLSLVAYPCRSCRKAKDVDILVQRDVFPRLPQLAAKQGFCLDHDDVYDRPQEYLIEIGGQQEYSQSIDGQVLRLEFHHRPHSGKWIRPEQEPDLSVLFQRALIVDLNGMQIKVFGYEDNLLHLCVHAAKHFFVLDKAIRMYVDIDRLVATDKIDWDIFINLARQYKVILPARIALILARILLGTDIPNDVFSKLDISPQRERFILRWVYRLGFFEPSEQKLNRLERSLFYSSLADNWFDSWGILVQTFFVPLSQLKLRYGFRFNLLVPYYYIYNAGRVIFRQRV